MMKVLAAITLVVGCGKSPETSPSAKAPSGGSAVAPVVGSAAIAATVNAGSASGELALTELVFYQGDDAVLKLHADGAIEVQHVQVGGASRYVWKPFAKLGKDGQLVKADGKTFRISPDGSVTMPDGRSASMFRFDADVLVVGPDQREVKLLDDRTQFDGDVFINKPDHRVSLDKTGRFLLDGEPVDAWHAPMRVEGASDPSTRHTALVLVGSLFGTKGMIQPIKIEKIQ